MRRAGRALLFSSKAGAPPPPPPPPPPPTARAVTSDPPRLKLPLRAGGVLSYTDPGAAGSAPHAIVALHGCPGSAFDWRYLGALLEPRARFIRLELPGHGESPLATCPSPELTPVLGVVDEAVRTLVPSPQRVWLMGHSLGCQLVLHYAESHPDKVAGVVLLNCAVNVQPHRGIRPWPVLRGLASVAERPAVAQLLQRPTKLLMTRLLGFHSRFSEEELVHGWRRVATMDFERHAALFARLRGMQLPVLKAWPKDDHLIEEHISQQTSLLLPAGPRLQFPSGGHMLVKTRAAEIADAMAEWMGLPGPADES